MSTALQYTPLDEIDSVSCNPALKPSPAANLHSQIHANLTAEFLKGRSRSVAFRKQQLSQLAWMVKDNQKKFEIALAQDLGKPPFEVFLCVPICSFQVVERKVTRREP